MNILTLWLADYYLAASVLLVLVWLAMRFERRLIHRVSIGWATSIALVGLLVMTTLPGMPKFALGLFSIETPSDNTPSLLEYEESLTRTSSEFSSTKNRDPQQSKLPGVPEPTADPSLDAISIAPTGVKRQFSSMRTIGVVFFLVGSAVSICWLSCGALLAWHWRRRCSPASSRWQAELAVIVPEGKRIPNLLVSRSLVHAVVLGFYRPVIVLPEFFLEKENKTAVRQALQHEWAHIAHCDHILMGLFRVLLPVLYLNPLFWWLRRVVAMNQELLADRAVASRSTPTSYAENLIRWMKNYGNRRPSKLVTTLGLWQQPRSFAERISALMEDSASVENYFNRSVKRQTVIVCFCLIPVASAFSVRTTSQPAQAPSNSLPDVPDASFTSSESSRLQDELYAIAGTVLDESGRPLAGVLVDACTWCTGNETLTDAGGRFKLRGFDADERIQVRFSKAGYSPQMFLDMKPGSMGCEVTLNQSTYIEGRVVNSRGIGMANAVVCANQGPKLIGSMVVQDIWSQTTTDDHGRYRLFVQPDRYEIEALSPGTGVAKIDSLLVADGEARQLDLELTAGAIFHATVIDAITGEPAQGVRLWAWKRPAIDAVSDDTGIIHVDDIPPGRYRLHLDSDRYARWWFATDSEEERAKRTKPDGWRREFDPRYVEIVDGMLPLKIYVEPGVRLTGLVVDPKSLPVAGATVAPVRTGTGNSLAGDTRYSVETDVDGAFEMLLPASGEAEYNLVAHDGKYREWRKWANGVSTPLQTQPGEIISGIVLQLTLPGIVRGRVLDDQGAPVTDHSVYVHSADGKGHRYFEPETKTSDDGSFVLSHVSPGEHLVQLSPLLITNASRKKDEHVRVSVHPGEVLREVTISEKE